LEPLITRETVALETPAIFAIPRMSIAASSPYSIRQNLSGYCRNHS
jgi:hypothetical protein